MTSIDTITLEVAGPAAAELFYTNAFGLDSRLRLRASRQPATGFRGFTLPVTKSLWGYGGVVQAPDGFAWETTPVAARP